MGALLARLEEIRKKLAFNLRQRRKVNAADIAVFIHRADIAMFQSRQQMCRPMKLLDPLFIAAGNRRHLQQNAAVFPGILGQVCCDDDIVTQPLDDLVGAECSRQRNGSIR